jgi:hypothetical protein
MTKVGSGLPPGKKMEAEVGQDLREGEYHTFDDVEVFIGMIQTA